MNIPDWLISSFAVFGFISLWCICAAAFGVLVGKLIDEMGK
jgi:hypothetical protein